MSDDMSKMTAAFCTGKETIELREVDVPSAGRGEVLVRVRLCGICCSGLHFDLGALVEPLAVCVHGLHLVGLRTGERVLVLGSGTIGVMTIYAAKAMGASDVVATFRYEHQGQGALMAGASRTVKDGETGGLEKEGFDVVAETVGGSAPTVAQAL